MINKDILIHINGEPFVCSAAMKLVDILIYLDFDIKLVTIEYNSKIILQSDLSTILLKSHDSVEVVTIVGGG
uniref:Thiamine biosynthesis protein S n=1 Tax=Hildenbrandia rubra TaxID=31481 RepID=A0A1C9CG91_9FLOR|nr:thiamine biosynthesis protein S [Hildenbrandia rubra]AOM67382.1 thiamine biosynthesis protein S [Hildenbrandia rubra]